MIQQRVHNPLPTVKVIVLQVIVLLGITPSLSLNAVAQVVNQGQESQWPPNELEWFERDVRPLLAEHCYSCHSSTVAKPKGGLKLDSREGILAGGESGAGAVPGKVEDSLIVQAIRRESYEMPPDKPLSERDRKTLERWVERGMPWSPTKTPGTKGDWVSQRAQEHWAWQPVRSVSPPQIEQDNWSLKPLDRFILAEHQANGLTPTSPSDSHALLRRLSLDLTGLPPDTRDVEHLIASKSADEIAWSQYVDRALASPQFGARWGRHWLDLTRYAETLGHEFDYPIRNAWQYREVVIDGFNIDLAYDQIVREHVAGDLLSKPRVHPVTGINQSLASTTWWWMGDTVHAPVDVQVDWATRIENQIDVFSKTFLGMTIACARCHDHKFDAISTQDYYGLSGILRSTRRLYRPTDPSGEIRESTKTLLDSIKSADQQAMQEYKTNSDNLRSWLDLAIQKLKTQGDKLDGVLPISHPLYPLRDLLTDDFSARQKETRAQHQNLRAAFAQWCDESPLLAEFSKGLPTGWSIHTALDAQHCEQIWMNEPIFDWFKKDLPFPNPQGFFRTQRIGRNQALVLRSPTFEVTKPVVSLKMHGKGAHSNVVAGNYYMLEFHQLLFGDLRKGIDQTAGWLTHAGDLNKYVGLPAFLSIECEPGNWFELAEVRISDRGPPVEPSLVAGQLLEIEADSSAAFLDQFAHRLSEAVERIGHGKAEQSDLVLVQSCGELSSQLTIEFPIEKAEGLKRAVARIRKKDGRIPAPTMLLTMSEGTPTDDVIAIRGNPRQSGEVVSRGCLQKLVSVKATEPHSSGRLELAESLVSSHPLTARVIVNRVWHHLMGRGLVDSTDNLGVLGGRPTHPQLLDYLSQELVNHDWSIKWLVREIALSQTYRMSSQPSEEHLRLDADGKLWSHRRVRRISAESLRDAMLSVAGSLDYRVNGPSVPIHLNDQMTGRGRPGNSGPLDGDNRRSIFVEVRRNFLDPFLVAFDFPMPATTVGNRNVSNVPAQALGLLNDPLVSEVAKRWAADVLREKDPTNRVRSMFLRAFAREVSETELQQCLALVPSASGPTAPDPETEKRAWADLAHVLLNAKEFSYVR